MENKTRENRSLMILGDSVFDPSSLKKNHPAKPEFEDNKLYLSGQLLVAMPQLEDRNFLRTVIFLCFHRPEGAMGIIINRLNGGVTYGELMHQLGIKIEPSNNDRPVHFGGPVEPQRGFVLHSIDRVEENTIVIEDGFGLTITTDILKSIYQGDGPSKNILALGYAAWGPGQLDAEIKSNSWMAVPADRELVFDPNLDKKWERAFTKIGVNLSTLSSEVGHA